MGPRSRRQQARNRSGPSYCMWLWRFGCGCSAEPLTAATARATGTLPDMPAVYVPKTISSASTVPIKPPETGNLARSRGDGGT